LLIVENTHFKT